MASVVGPGARARRRCPPRRPRRSVHWVSERTAGAVAGDEEKISAEDASTEGLIRYYREHREG